MKHLPGKHIIHYLFVTLLFYSCAPKGFVKSSGNILTHENSNMAFPKAVGNFSRTESNVYDQFNDNISVGYNIRSASCNLTITIYVYPHFNKSLDAELTQIKDVIEYVYKEHELVLENEVNHKQENLSVIGKQVLYKVTDKYNKNSIDQYSMAYLFVHGNWFYKYRITYPKAYLDCANSEIDKLLTSLNWPEY